MEEEGKRVESQMKKEENERFIKVEARKKWKRETFLFIKNQFLEDNKVAINSEDNIDTT